ncbi:hypothetical protein Scep_016600 [Stephania cephalantha]|uniref:Uncharacterized protein n=1 Tax=Stephania cephalantha TaxID=152367 RepID=A0AAP0NSS2_9MAGN
MEETRRAPPGGSATRSFQHFGMAPMRSTSMKASFRGRSRNAKERCEKKRLNKRDCSRDLKDISFCFDVVESV